VPWGKENTLTVAKVWRQTLGQIVMRHSGHSDDDQINATHDRQMGADEEGDGKFFLAIFDKLDAAALVDGRQSALGARKEPNLVASQREISRRGAAAVTSTENCYLTNRHENRILRIEPVVF